VLAAKDADLVKPWDAKGYKMPGGAPYHPAGFMTFVGASAMVHGKTMGVYPAAKALLSAVYEGALVPFDTALKIEARWFTSVLMNPSSSAMIRSSSSTRRRWKRARTGPRSPTRRCEAGRHRRGHDGRGHRLCGRHAGIEVVLIDATQEAADRGKAPIPAGCWTRG
jgi:3-hydroxyacyl-CoA dehydrogenase / enoyl-CoA hydratase / 3-hydroxybutyryl-CoA epimerase